MYERFIYIPPRNLFDGNPLALQFYGVPQFLARAVDEIVKDYKTKEVKTKELWKDVDKPLTADVVTGEMRTRLKNEYGSGLVLEYADSLVGRNFTLLKIDVNKRMMVGRLLSQDQSYKPAAPSANAQGQSVIERRGNGKDFVVDGVGQFIPRYMYRCLNNQDVVNLTNNNVFAIRAKSMTAGNTMLEHVGGQKLTRYISTTRARHEIQNPHGETFDGGSKVKIDLSYIASSKITDLSTEKGETELRKFIGQGTPTGLNLQALKDVKRTKEVLIELEIPGEAIVGTRGFTLQNVTRVGNNEDF